MAIYSSDDIKLIQEFKENCFKCVLGGIKGSVSQGNKKYLKEDFEQYGFTGPYTYLKKYYKDNIDDMLEVICLLWDEVD